MKKFLILSAIVIGGWLLADTVWALDLGLDSAKNAAAGAGYDAAGTTESTLAQTIGTFIRGILTVSGVIFTCLVFYAGFLWMTARGDEGQVEKAKEIIRAGVIGLTVALAAFGITNLVMRLVAGGSAGTGGPSPSGGNGGCQVNPAAIELCASKTEATCASEPQFSCSWTVGGCKAYGESACPIATNKAECLADKAANCVYVD